MIDFIKIQTENKENLETIIKSNLGDTICSMNYRSGEIQYPCRQYLNNLEVRITKNKGIIRNSLHKFYNAAVLRKPNNFTDFDLKDIEDSLEQLCYEISNEVLDYKVTNLEFGLNIETNSPPKALLENNFVLYNFDNFNQIDTFKNQGFYKQYNRSEYLLKFYDKGLQYRLPNNLMRLEIKIIDSRLLKKLGVNTLKDIQNPEVLESLFKFFMEKVGEVNIIDNTTMENIPFKDKNFILLGKCASYWQDLQINKSSSTYYEHRKKYNTLLSQYNLLTIKDEILIKLEDKFEAMCYPFSIN